MRFLIFLFGIFSCLCLFAQESSVQDGFVRYTYPNGNVSSEGLLIKGKPNGYWKTYYVTGVLKSIGTRKNFLLDSVWIFFNETGDTTEKINYILGKRNGFYYKYETIMKKNGTVRNIITSKELFVNDKREGMSYYYYPNGKIHEIINYRNNKRHGFGKEFDKDSIVISQYEYFNDYLIDKQIINRKINGEKIGVWKDFYPNGKVKIERTYSNNLLNGVYKEFTSSGSVKQALVYVDDKLIKNLIQDSLNIDEKVSYYENGKIRKRGYYKGGIPVGIHREYDTDGNVKNSYVYDDFGKITSEGIVKEDGSREGKWEYFFDDGEVKSEGIYLNNKQNGEWKYFYKGAVPEQVGSFSNGVLSGVWKFYFPNGKVSKWEHYQKGRRDSVYFEYSSHGDTVVVGKFSEGEMNGLWTIKSGDVKEEGTYLNGLKQGEWKMFYDNGKLRYQGNYIQGSPDGKHYYYYDNGRIEEEQFYVNGVKEKNWRRYTEEGALSQTVTYQNDVEIRINGYRIDNVKRR